jgi:hypothetical protein
VSAVGTPHSLGLCYDRHPTLRWQDEGRGRKAGLRRSAQSPWTCHLAYYYFLHDACGSGRGSVSDAPACRRTMQHLTVTDVACCS